MFKQILIRYLQRQEHKDENERHRLITPSIPVGIAGIADARHEPARTVVLPLPSNNDDGKNDEEGALTAKTIAMIAMRARCQEALSFLRYVRRVLEEKGEDAAAAAAAVAAGHGWDWVEENCR